MKLAKNKFIKVSYFGYLPEKGVNGGEVKALSLLNELRLIGKDNLRIKAFNIKGWRRKIITVIIWILYAFCFSDDIIFVCGTGQMTNIIKYIVRLNAIFKRKIHFIPVGNCEYEVLKTQFNFYKEGLIGIYVETEGMMKKLQEVGMENVCVMHNFKKLHRYCVDYNSCETFYFCFFSRVSKVKGIMDTIDVFKRLIYKGINCKLDIYGKIDDDIEEDFYKEMADCNEFINYKGVADSNESSNILKDYFMMIFPTKFDGEGFPGVIIDSFAAGTPVLSSKFNNSNDMLINNKTGLLFEYNNYNDLEEKIIYAINNKDKIDEMRKYCYLEYEKYSPLSEIKILHSKL